MSKMTTYRIYCDGKSYWVQHFEYKNKKLNHWNIDIADGGNHYISLTEHDLAFAIKAIKDAKRGKLYVDRVDV